MHSRPLNSVSYSLILARTPFALFRSLSRFLSLSRYQSTTKNTLFFFLSFPDQAQNHPSVRNQIHASRIYSLKIKISLVSLALRRIFSWDELCCWGGRGVKVMELEGRINICMLYIKITHLNTTAHLKTQHTTRGSFVRFFRDRDLEIHTQIFNVCDTCLSCCFFDFIDLYSHSLLFKKITPNKFGQQPARNGHNNITGSSQALSIAPQFHNPTTTAAGTLDLLFSLFLSFYFLERQVALGFFCVLLFEFFPRYLTLKIYGL